MKKEVDELPAPTDGGVIGRTGRLMTADSSRESACLYSACRNSGSEHSSRWDVGNAAAQRRSLPTAMAATLLPATYHRWHVFESGYGCCFYGHGKSLDPHWRLE